ncbi:MAG: LptF/LptG family permease [Bacteroidales bacterium]
MTKLQRYILNSFIGPLIITFFISIFLLLMQFLWKYIDDLVGKGLEWTVIAELLLYASVTLVPMGLPLAILLSSLMTFGNLGETYELFALKSSGISLYRIMKPLIVLVVFVSVGAFYFSNNLLPYTNLKMRTLLYDVRNQRPEVSIQEGIFTDAVDGFSIKVREKDKDDNTLRDVLIYDHRNKRKNASIITAESGSMKVTPDKSYIIFKLYNGHLYDEIKERKQRGERTYPYQTTDFDQQTIYIRTEGFGLNRSDEDLFKDNFEMLSLDQLDTAMDSLGYDLIQRKQVVGTNVMKYSLFRGLRVRSGQTKKGKVVHQEKSTSVKKGGILISKKEEIIKDSASDKEQEDVKQNTKAEEKESNPTDLSKTPSQNNRRQVSRTLDAELEKEDKKEKESANNFPFPILDTVDKTRLRIVDIDSIFQAMSTTEKNRTVNFAQNHARSAQSYVYYAGKDIENSRRWITRHEIEWHKKFVLSISCLVLFFVGAPLGAIIRKGGFGMPVVISVILFIIYFIISMFSEKMVRENVLPAEIGMWVSTFILLPVGVLLTIKAANDSMNIRPESYNKLKQSLRLKRKRKRHKRKINH